jgi:type II secretory pathway pseudopilin PulG
MKMKAAILVLALLLLSALITALVEGHINGPSRRAQFTREAIQKVVQVAERYRSDSGAWPPVANDRPGVIIDDKVLLWVGPYLRTWPDDAWGVPLRYTLPDGRPEIRSAGPDRKFDTEDDLTNR